MDYYHGSKPVGTSITLVAGNNYEVKLTGANANGWGFASSSSDITVSATSIRADTRIELRVSAHAKPSVVSVSPTQRTVAPVASPHPHGSSKRHGHSAAIAPAPPKPTTASQVLPPPALAVTILPVLSLPPAASEEGALARMYLSEAQNPGYPPGQTYVLEDVVRSMRWMREVLDNQRNLAPRSFGAARDATRSGTSLIDMMRAQGNVAGFERYPSINTTMLDSLLRSANDANQFMFEKYRKHVEGVLTEASRETKDCPVKVYSWRTAGSSDPGSNYVFYKTLAGQDFYTLNPDFEAAIQKEQDKREAKSTH